MARLLVFLVLILQSFSWSARHRVNMVNFAFVPDTLIVVQGDIVVWVNTTGIIHTSTSGVAGVPNGVWDSENVSPGDSFSFTFNIAPNTYPYYCHYHWMSGMIGAIVVALGIEDSKYTQVGMSIDQNYPEPFHSTTTVNYEISKPGSYTMHIYNSAGKPMKKFKIQHPVAGIFSMTWDGTDDASHIVPNGVYFLRFDNDNKRATEKLLFIK